VTSFFVPGTPRGEQTNRAYEDMRQYVGLSAGRPARARRIFKLSCRRRGADCEISVGADDGSDGQTVHAIFDVGDAYAILWHGGHELLPKRRTYRAVEFD
jgi:hypothetical protein